MSDPLYINGRFTTTDEKVIGVEDRGLLFGDGVYEVVKFLRRKPIFVDEHFKRLQSGLAQLEISNPWTIDSFRTIMRELLMRTVFDDGTIYFQVTRGEGERAHFYQENLEPTAFAFTRKVPFPDDQKRERGIRVITTPDIRWGLCGIKSVNLLGNVLAKKKAERAGADEAIFVKDGEIKEGASSSFFAVVEGRLITHPSDECILPGTVRDHVISLALRDRIRVAERPVRDYELLTLEEAFVTSTTQSVMPIAQIDGRIIGNGRMGDVARRLQQLYADVERAEMAKEL